MSLGSALNIAVAGLNTAKVMTQVTSQNVANATTPGYARRDVTLSPSAVGGVEVVSINRAENTALQADRLSADARSADAQLKAEAMSRLERSFGLPEDEEGLFAAFTRFETALEDLAAAPESPTYQSGAVDAAKDLTRTFNRIGDEVTRLRTEADEAIAADVDKVNRALEALDTLNAAAGRKAPAEIGDLGEQRQRQIDVIATALDIDVLKAPGNQIRIRTAEGVTLLGEDPQRLEFTRGPVAAPGVTLADGELSGLSVNGISLTPGAGAQSLRAGSIAANFAVRDDIAPEFEGRMDALAESLVARFEDPATDPTATAGNGLFVDPLAGAGIASRLRVNGAVDPALGGEVWRLRDGVAAGARLPEASGGNARTLIDGLAAPVAIPVATDSPAALSLIDATAQLASVVGTDRVDRASTAAAAAATAQGLADEELAQTGVNTDQELQSLLLIEQAYAANARVIQVVNEMLARLLEI